MKYWIEEVDKKFRSIVHYIRWFGADVFLSGFDWNEAINLKDKLEQTGDAATSPEVSEKFKKIPEEFVINVIELYHISRSVKNKVNRVKYLEKLLPPNSIINFFLIFACLAFFAGVIIPIISQTTRKFFIVWFPILFYSCFLTYLVFKVSINIR